MLRLLIRVSTPSAFKMPLQSGWLTELCVKARHDADRVVHDNISTVLYFHNVMNGSRNGQTDGIGSLSMPTGRFTLAAFQ